MIRITLSSYSMSGSIKYIKSAVLPQDWPDTRLPEIAFAGRSNAGKSSLINAVVNSKVAHVSSTPGKTRLLSFFDVNRKYILVDSPGYGFAARGNDDVSLWQQMMEDYLTGREQLRGLVLVMDIRREWTDEEQGLLRYMNSRGLQLIIAATKADKLTNNEYRAAVARLRKSAKVEHIFPVSSLKKTGVKELEEFIYHEWCR